MDIQNKNQAWETILDALKFGEHDLQKGAFNITAKDIKKVTSTFGVTSNTLTEPRLLCKQDCREDRPQIFIDNNLFILPVKNGEYVILQGDGYVDIPVIMTQPVKYNSKLGFKLDTSVIGDSEMQYLDKAYASSIIRTFMKDPSLVLTIRGRKYTPAFDFIAGGQHLHVESVQTEVDAGYEGENAVVLIEAKNFAANNTIIRQLYYPFRQWQSCTDKPVKTLFFEHNKNTDVYSIWEFVFDNFNNYNSIRMSRSAKFIME